MLLFALISYHSVKKLTIYMDGITVIIFLALCSPFQFCNSLAVPFDTSQLLSTDNSLTTDMDETNSTMTIEDLYGSALSDDSTGRKKRSVAPTLNESVSTEFPTTTTNSSDDFSYLSEHFMNCTHVYIEPERYEKLDNGSIFVPLYKKVFDRSDFLINDDALYICSDWAIDETDVTTLSIEDLCGSPLSDDSENRRRKRSIWHMLNESESTETPTEATNVSYSEDFSYLSEKFLNCTHIYLDLACYEQLDNGSVYVPLYKKVFNRSDFIINEDLLFICPDFFGEIEKKRTFSSHISIISMVGSAISTLCLILHIIVYICIKTVKKLPSRCLLSLCIALLKAYFFTFVQHAATDDTSCLIVGMCMVYYFLASFFWMNVFSYDVWRSIRLATTKLRLTADRPMMVRFARYSIYAWGSPLLIIILSIITHYSTSNVKYQLIFDSSICWFAHKQALTLYFAGPLFMLLGINILLTISSFVMISTASIKVKSGNSGNSESFDLRSRFCLSIRLGSSMGLTWIFGVIAIATKQEWLWYLFSICSALQGVFIFFSFTVSERSRKECRKVLKSRKGSMPTQISSQPSSTV